MEKRGQFFLIAAFVIIMIILGLANIYVYAKAKSFDDSVYVVASDLKKESLHLINQGKLNGQSEEVIRDKVKELVEVFSSNYPFLNFTEVYTSPPAPDIYIWRFNNGQEVANPASYQLQNGNVSVSLNNKTYIFELNEGYNVYTIVEKKEENEFIVATQ